VFPSRDREGAVTQVIRALCLVQIHGAPINVRILREGLRTVSLASHNSSFERLGHSPVLSAAVHQPVLITRMPDVVETLAHFADGLEMQYS
jgi:hypothetical protein